MKKTKRTILIGTLSILALMSVSCGSNTQSNSSVVETSNTNVSTESVTMRDEEDVKKQVSEFDRMAYDIKNTAECWTVDLYTMGIGCRDSDKALTVDITVEDFNWTVSAFEAGTFNESSRLSFGNWGKEGKGKAGDNINDTTNGESHFAVYLANIYPQIENASIKLTFLSGYCKSVAYTNETTKILEEGIDCPKINNGSFAQTFNWDSTEGLSPNGFVVGTAPKVGQK